MAYPGEGSLDPKVQQRVMTAFAEAVRLYREGHNEEAITILRSITDVDPQFAPGQRLDAAIVAGAPVDLAKLLGDMSAPDQADMTATVAKAKEAMVARDFQGALALAQAALRELPGHGEARQIALEAQARLRATTEVRSLLQQAAQALDAGMADEARNILRVARAKDAGDPAVAAFAVRLGNATPATTAAQPEFEFEVFDQLPRSGSVEDRPLPAAEDLRFSAEMPLAAPAAEVRPAGRTATLTGPVATRPAAAGSAAPSPVPAVPVWLGAAAGAPPPMPAAPAPAEPDLFAAPTANQGSGDISFDVGRSGAIDFNASSSESAPGGAVGGEDGAVKAQELLDQGQDAFGRGDFSSAIDTWSRIFLIDAHHPEAELRIEQARRRREEVDRQVEHLFYDARDAFDAGRVDEARSLCQDVLRMQPQHLEAHDLLTRIETPAAPPPPAAPPAADEDDLFRDDFVPANISSSGSIPTVQGAAVPAVRERTGAVATPVASRLPKVSPRMLMIAAAVLILVAGGVFLLRGRVFSGGTSAVTEALVESQRLVKDDRLQDAVQVLQSIQAQADGEQAKEISQRLLDFQRRLRAKAAQAKAVDLAPIHQAVADGHRLKALQLIAEGLAKAPGDLGLEAARGEIATYDAALPALVKAVGSGDWDGAQRAAAAIREQHAGDVEAKRAWQAATYNHAVALARTYRVAEANSVITQLARETTDADIERLREMTRTYLTRPTDPRYDIFVRNIELRRVE